MVDLQKLVTLKSNDQGASPAKALNERLTLFEAVRRLTEDEGLSSWVINDDGKTLSGADILHITNSQEYRDLMLAFDDRR